MPAALLLIAATGESAASAEAERVFQERARAIAADEACDLFVPAERRVLEAGLLQSRRDLRQAGIGDGLIETALSRIRTDRTLADCDSARVEDIARRSRAAAEQILRQPWYDFDGPTRRWQADRTGYDFVRWPVLQEAGTARFGLAVIEETRRGEARITAPAFAVAGHGEAVSAVIVARDTRRMDEPYDRTLGGLAPLPHGEPLARYSAPPFAERRIFAAERLPAERAARLAFDTEQRDGPAAAGFVFSRGTLETLAGLAPHESAAIELIDGRGRVIARIHVEIGHLAAALDFAALPYNPAMASR